MKKYYYLKNGNMYLQSIFTNGFKVSNEFIESIIITTNYERCSQYLKEDAEELKKKLFIVLGIKFELKEVDIDED